METPDKNKVLKGFECCLNAGCENCPYDDDRGIDIDICQIRLMHDLKQIVEAYDPTCNVKTLTVTVKPDAEDLDELRAEYDSMASSVNEASELIRMLRDKNRGLEVENQKLEKENARLEHICHCYSVQYGTVRDVKDEEDV